MPVLDCRVPKQNWIQVVTEQNGVSLLPNEQIAERQVKDAGPWEPAVRKIVTYQQLADDWDGFGAKAPARELLESAIGLAYLFCESGVASPHRVAPGVDGSVIFEWQFPDGTYAEVEIVRPLYAEVMLIEPGQPAKHWTLPPE